MSETTTPWPLVPGSLVTARFAQVYGDSSDEDYNTEWVPLVGQKLIFTPSITGPIVYDPAGAKIIAELKPFLGVVNPDGFVVANDGDHPIRLLPTNDPLMSRTGWLWTCTWSGGKVIFPVPSAGEVNIADFIVAPPGNPAIEEWVEHIPELIDAAGSLSGINIADLISALESGSGVEEVSGTVVLDESGPRLRQFYTVGAATIGGMQFPEDTAVVFRRTAVGAWSHLTVDWDGAVTTVTPTAPTFTDPSGTANDRYTIPAKTGVEYRKGGAAIAAGTYTPTAGESVTITAVALDGYTLTGTTSWSKTFSTATAPTSVTATAPTWTDNEVDGGGTWTTPTIAGVTYSPASGTATQGQSVTVTAAAQAGYTLTGTTSWSHTFPLGDAPFPPPANLAYTRIGNDFTFTWDAVDGVSDYSSRSKIPGGWTGAWGQTTSLTRVVKWTDQTPFVFEVRGFTGINPSIVYGPSASIEVTP